MDARIIGHISVDAGIVWVGDPCYILHKETPPKAIGDSWTNFCEILGDNTILQFDHDRGYKGLGICTSTPHGDGHYPVIGFFEGENKRPSAIMVDYSNIYYQLTKKQL